MGNGMNKVLEGVYIGSLRDSQDKEQMKANGITHVLAIHDNPKEIFEDKIYLCINVSDSPNQDLTSYFSKTNDFIHKARLSGGCVLIHCIAGVSRSVTVAVVYIMTVTDLTWREALNAVRGARTCANPNFGFQRQLQTYEFEKLSEEKCRFVSTHKLGDFNDLETCKKNLEAHQRFVLYGEDESNTYPLGHNVYRQGIPHQKRESREEMEDNANLEETG